MEDDRDVRMDEAPIPDSGDRDRERERCGFNFSRSWELE
jgi:hypothetical protein